MGGAECSVRRIAALQAVTIGLFCCFTGEVPLAALGKSPSLADEPRRQAFVFPTNLAVRLAGTPIALS